MEAFSESSNLPPTLPLHPCLQHTFDLRSYGHPTPNDTQKPAVVPHSLPSGRAVDPAHPSVPMLPGCCPGRAVDPALFPLAVGSPEGDGQPQSCPWGRWTPAWGRGTTHCHRDSVLSRACACDSAQSTPEDVLGARAATSGGGRSAGSEVFAPAPRSGVFPAIASASFGRTQPRRKTYPGDVRPRTTRGGTPP
jgi:hypothetical protein